MKDRNGVKGNSYKLQTKKKKNLKLVHLLLIQLFIWSFNKLRKGQNFDDLIITFPYGASSWHLEPP